MIIKLRQRELLKVKLNQTNINQKIDESLNKLNCDSKSFFTVDMGNTHPHIGHFEGASLKDVKPFGANDLVPLKAQSNWVSSNVTNYEIPKENRLNHLRLENSFLDMKVDYSKTLGEDRLYQAYFLHKLFPQEKITLIDAGTFITVDHIDSEGFKGGFIFPGIRIFLNTYQRGQRLNSDLELPTNLDISLPKNTQDAMIEASKSYLRGILETCVEKESTVILTGGNGKLLADSLGLDTYFPHLIHYSLFFIAHFAKSRLSN